MSQRKRTNRVALAVLAFASMIALSGAAFAAGPGVNVKAKGSVDEVLANLKKMVADNGMMVMGELHQGKVLAMTGLKVESETVFVGNPTVGKEIFTEEPGAGGISAFACCRAASAAVLLCAWDSMCINYQHEACTGSHRRAASRRAGCGRGGSTRRTIGCSASGYSGLSETSAPASDSAPIPRSLR